MTRPIDHSQVVEFLLLVAERRLQAGSDPAKLAELDRLLRQSKETGRIPDELRSPVTLTC
jgi:hypothetical protein